jgi:hypothetical protein
VSEGRQNGLQTQNINPSSAKKPLEDTKISTPRTLTRETRDFSAACEALEGWF